MKPVVRLWEEAGIGLIVLRPTGVLFSNQTGGFTCLQPREEGFYFPLGLDPTEIMAYFAGPPWRGSCDGGVDDGDADFLDAQLAQSRSLARHIRVDRERMGDSHEAWIYVRVAEETVRDELKMLLGLGPAKGVLTWPNSD